MKLLVYIELLTTLLLLTQQSCALYPKELNLAVIAPKAVNLNKDYSIVISIAESDKPVAFKVSLVIPFSTSNNWRTSKVILVLPNESEVCTFQSKDISKIIPLNYLNQTTDTINLEVFTTDFLNSFMSIPVLIKDTNAPLILFQTDKGKYTTGESMNYQITILDENYQPLNQITSLQVTRKCTTSPSILGEPIPINATEYQSIFTGSFKVLESMESISITGNQLQSSSGQEVSFEETFTITHSLLEKLANKSTLRVNMELSRTLIPSNEPNITVTLSLMDTKDGTYLGGNCVLELTNPHDLKRYNSKVFRIPLNPNTGMGHTVINAIRGFDIEGIREIQFVSVCEDSLLKRTSEEVTNYLEVLENIYLLKLMWNEISPSANGMIVLSLWFHLSRWDLRRVDISREEVLTNVTLSLNIKHVGGKLILFNASEINVIDSPTGKLIKVECVLPHFTKFDFDDYGSITVLRINKYFRFLGKYGSHALMNPPLMNVSPVNQGGNVERGKNASFYFDSDVLPSLEKYFTFTAVLHSDQNIITRSQIHFASKFNSSRFQSLNETFEIFIPQNLTIPNLFLTVYGLFETPGRAQVEKIFCSSTTNIYLSSPAILNQLSATDSSETMLTEVKFRLEGSVESITEVSWTITKLGVDNRSEFEKYQELKRGEDTSPVSLIESTTKFLRPQKAFNKKVTFPKHVHMTYTIQYREFLHTKNIQPNGTISFSKIYDKFTEHGEYVISAMTVYNKTSSTPGLHFTNQIRFIVSPPPLTLHMTAPESVIVGQSFQVQTTVKNPSNKLYEGNVTLNYYYEEQNKTSLSEHVKLDGNSWVNIIFPITTYDDSTLVLDFQSNISPSLTVQKLITVRYPVNGENNNA